MIRSVRRGTNIEGGRTAKIVMVDVNIPGVESIALCNSPVRKVFSEASRRRLVLFCVGYRRIQYSQLLVCN